ncbi:Tyrosine recombinase XerC [Dyadobacter sp. CECT 9275]|uniref:Tyrosine recombinase XerC n=1 Tax=Dyadobacter helix TaxID=2822344 RepID=A0A916NDJ5_9BACT|nr:site-specific integrase [Dyadobacter sp. CECT 9275]CAG5011215.1 Tyrosine recombinase XerC [Dyadobacter sp. CECT 9275]
MSNLKQFFGYADSEELISQDPTRRLTKERVGGREKPRKRFLNNQEIKTLSGILPRSTMRSEYQHLIWLLLATGCRVNEVLRMKWKHIDFEKRQLHIPSEHAKNTNSHDVYLSNFAVAQLRALEKTRTTDWLVPGRSERGPATRQVLTKQVTDRQKKPGAKSRVQDDQALVLPNGRWVIHDLRRTTATVMQELGIMPYIVKKCLNQKIEDKIVETYQRAQLKRQQQDAFKKMGAFLERSCQKRIKPEQIPGVAINSMI